MAIVRSDVRVALLRLQEGFVCLVSLGSHHSPCAERMIFLSIIRVGRLRLIIGQNTCLKPPSLSEWPELEAGLALHDRCICSASPWLPPHSSQKKRQDTPCIADHGRESPWPAPTGGVADLRLAADPHQDMPGRLRAPSMSPFIYVKSHICTGKRLDPRF